MFYIEPNTRIEFLRGVPLDPGYENTLYFDTLAQQDAYFYDKLALAINRASYQREERGWLKVSWNAAENVTPVISTLYNISYMRFKNSNFENKWFYAFVDAVEYVNNNTVRIRYHIDVMQTWAFDYSFNQCMIEREHTETDNIGENTIPENFELGDYIFDNAQEFNYEPTAVVVTAGDFGGSYGAGVVVPGLSTKGDWFSGVHFYPFPLHVQQQVDALNQMLEDAYTDRDKLNTIIAVFVMPNSFITPNFPPQEFTESVITASQVGGYMLGDYPCRNAKLLTYPYNLLYVTNYQGGHMELHFEYFSNPTNCKLKVWGNMSVNPALILYPNNYKTTGDNFDEMLECTGFPMCAWANDAYKAWVAQNAGTIASTALTIVGGMAYGAYKSFNYTPDRSIPFTDMGETRRPLHTGESLGFTPSKELVGSIVAAVNAVGKVADHAVAPPTAHGSGNGNVQYQAGKMTFMWCHKHIRPEYAAIIDDFFDMYGYATHRVGYPRRDVRPCYTYVKTVDCSMDGNVPMEDLRTIENIFNKGVRFWKSTAVFGVFDNTVNNNAPLI